MHLKPADLTGPILVAHPSTEVTAWIAGHLREASYRVEVAHDREAALEHLERHRPVLLLVEEPTSWTEGWELPHYWRHTAPFRERPLGFLRDSSHQYPEEIVSYTPVCDFRLSAPYDAAELLRMMDAILLHPVDETDVRFQL